VRGVAPQRAAHPRKGLIVLAAAPDRKKLAPIHDDQEHTQLHCDRDGDGGGRNDQLLVARVLDADDRSGGFVRRRLVEQ
jgi:hypothetical protein